MGYSVTMTIRKMMVRETSNVFSAISLGVFFLEAPSTSAIIRSKKLLPGSEVIRIFSQSDTMVVPPVTEQKSPPDSRTTGADSPVIADSSTEAMPSITSPSPGIISPAETITTSPFFSWLERTSFSVPFSSKRRALVSFWVFFKLAACAFPRPSATDSAKFANKAVMNKMMQTITLYRRRLVPALTSPNNPGKMERSSVMIQPTSTTNITGFFIMYLGLSFVKDPITA